MDNFIRLVCGCDPYTEEAKAITKVSRKRLGDYRNKLNKAVVELVEEFKELKQRELQRIPVLPPQHAVDQFIDESVVKNRVLQRFIASTNEAELKHNGSFNELVQFVRECFKIFCSGIIHSVIVILVLDTFFKTKRNSRGPDNNKLFAYIIIK